MWGKSALPVVEHTEFFIVAERFKDSEVILYKKNNNSVIYFFTNKTNREAALNVQEVKYSEVNFY